MNFDTFRQSHFINEIQISCNNNLFATRAEIDDRDYEEYYKVKSDWSSKVEIWDLKSRNHLQHLQHNDRVRRMQFSKTGKLLATTVGTSERCEIFVWKLDDFSTLQNFPIILDLRFTQINSIYFSSDDSQILINHSDGSFIFDLKSASLIYVKEDACEIADFGATNQELWSVSLCRRILWSESVNTSHCFARLLPEDQLHYRIFDFAVPNDGNVFVVADSNGDLRIVKDNSNAFAVFDSRGELRMVKDNSEHVEKIHVTNGYVAIVRISPDNKFIYTYSSIFAVWGAENGYIDVWCLETYVRLRRILETWNMIVWDISKTGDKLYVGKSSDIVGASLSIVKLLNANKIVHCTIPLIKTNIFEHIVSNVVDFLLAYEFKGTFHGENGYFFAKKREIIATVSKFVKRLNNNYYLLMD